MYAKSLVRKNWDSVAILFILTRCVVCMYFQNPLITGAKSTEHFKNWNKQVGFFFGIFDAEIANPFCCCHERCRLCEKKVAKHNGDIIFFWKNIPILSWFFLIIHSTEKIKKMWNL